jgi:cell division transport system ATP-binding protein
VIRFEKVTKTYPGQTRPALDNVTVDLEKGDFAFLVGASGSGKSTFMRLILREARPSNGRVYVAGKEINRLAGWKVPKLRRQIGTVFQDFRLLPNKTVNENVAFALQVIGKSRSHIRSVVPETLELVGLADKGDRMPDELSGGEQQRVAIARAFVNRPMILIADEPTGNLDPATSADIMALLERINSTGTTLLMATHDSGLVNRARKRVIQLAEGHLVRDEDEGGYELQPQFYDQESDATSQAPGPPVAPHPAPQPAPPPAPQLAPQPAPDPPKPAPDPLTDDLHGFNSSTRWDS